MKGTGLQLVIVDVNVDMLLSSDEHDQYRQFAYTAKL